MRVPVGGFASKLGSGLSQPDSPFAPPEKTSFEWLSWDPLMWLLDKFNRPQQAIFSGIHEALTDDTSVSGWRRAWDALIKGDDVRFADIMDEVGLRGQAGKFDPLDILGVAGEILLDPINLIGVGALGKLGKAGKAASMFAKADDAAILKKATEAGMKLTKSGRLPYNISTPGQLGADIVQEAQRLVGPDAFSHYLKVGWGKNWAAIPGSNIALEPLIKVGKGIRRKFGGLLSTQPETLEKAVPMALQNIINKHRSGVTQLMRHLEKGLPNDWKGGRLSNAVETGAKELVKDAPEEVQKAYEMGVWFSEHLPQLEEMSGVMTKKLDVSPGAFGAKGVGGEVVSFKPTYGKNVPSSVKTTVDKAMDMLPPYIKESVARRIKNVVMSSELEQEGAQLFLQEKVLGIGSIRDGENVETLVHEMVHSYVNEIDNTEFITDFIKASYPDTRAKKFLDELPQSYSPGGPNFSPFSQEDITGGFSDYVLKKKMPDDLRKVFEKHFPTDVPTAPTKTYADLMETMGMDPASDEVVNHFVHSVTKDAREYIQKHDIRGTKRYRGAGTLSTAHASQLMREIPGTIDDINEGSRWIFTPRGALKKAWIDGNKALRFDIEGAAKKFAKGEVSDGARKLAKSYGTTVDDLFAESSHFKKFDKFFEDDYFSGLTMRLGRHVQSRAVGETFQQVLGAQNEAGNLSWARPIADAPDDWVNLADEMPKKALAGMEPNLKAQIEGSLFEPKIAKAMKDGLRVLYEPEVRSEFLSGFRKAMSWLRASTILPFGGYHMANLAGNRWGRFVADVHGLKYDKISRIDLMPNIAAGNTKALRGLKYNLSGSEFTGEDLMHIIFSNDIASGGSMTTETVGYGLFGKAARGADPTEGATLLDMINPFSRKQYGAKVAKNLEDGDRIAHFVGRLDKGDTVAEAAASVEKHLFRYSDLSKAETGTAGMPGIRDFTMFYTWYRKNIGLTFQKMWEYPGRLSMPIKVRNAMDGIYGDPDSEYAVPEYLRDQFYFYLGKDVEGKGKFLDPEKYLPPLSAGKFFQRGIKGPYEELVSMFIPPIKGLFELGAGEEAFSGAKIEKAPGEKKFMFGGETTPFWSYVGKNFRILNSINKALWPSAQTEGGYVKAGEPGDRPPGSFYEQGVRREWGGYKLQTTDAQKNRYFEAISPEGRINTDLKKINSKMAGKTSPLQRDSYIKARNELLWEKAEVLRQVIEDGRDPFTGKEMPWEPPMPEPGLRKPHAMRTIYTELHSTLRALYFGEPPSPGVLVVPQKTRINPAEAEQVHDTMTKLKIDMLGKDMQFALGLGGKSGAEMFDNRVSGPIRDIVKTEGYYERSGNKPGWDTHIYDYDYGYRKNLVMLWGQYLMQGFEAGLYDRKGLKTRVKTYQELYLPDYV